MGKRCFKYFKTSFHENENLICMYISYWGNLNLHIDVHEIIFSSPSSFGKYYCSSCIFMLRFNLSHSLPPIAYTLVFPSMVHFFSGFRLRTAFVVYPILKCSWPFTPDLSSHFLVIFLPLTLADAHFIFILYLLHFCIPLLEYILLYLFSYHCSVYHFC